MLDASKAFDRVEYVRLFILLRERALCPVVLLHLIINMYVNQCIQIKLNSMIPAWTILALDLTPLQLVLACLPRR